MAESSSSCSSRSSYTNSKPARVNKSSPHQPRHYSFPSRSFGNKGEKRCFKSSWFDSWAWLDYQEVSDTVLCHYCSMANSHKFLSSNHYGKREDTFVTKGFMNWKDTCSSFRRHEASKYHIDAAGAVTKPHLRVDVGEMLLTTHAEQKQRNSRMLQTIIQTLKFLARQAIPMRGHVEEESNFIQLLKLRSTENEDITSWIERKGGDKYTSPEIQNELLDLMSQAVICKIMLNIGQSAHFTLMTDECVDSANNEQLVVCLRYVDTDLEVHEEFIGLYHIPNTAANTIVSALKDTLVRLNLDLSRCRGQCYDGASAMSGTKSGVKTQILKEEPRALFTHCYGHSLSLSVADTVKMLSSLRHVMDTVHELSKLLQYSPKRCALFKDIKVEFSPDTVGFRVLCPTRWTVRHETFRSVLQNYTVLLELWERILNDKPDSEIRARVNGIDCQMKTFQFYFGVSLLCNVLSHTDNLSKTLQGSSVSAAEGQHLVAMVISTLESIRNEEKYKLFWQIVTIKANDHGIGEPTVPRKRKVPKRYKEGHSSGATPSSSPEDHYRVLYYEAIDTVVNCIKDRFEQEGYRMYCKLEQLIIVPKENDVVLDEVVEFYGDDLDRDILKAQLHLFHAKYETPKNMKEVISLVKDMSSGEKSLLSQVMTIISLLLVMPATNAVSERSFSAMRRVKTYLRASMLQKRLNALMVLHIHKDLTDAIDEKSIIGDFIALSDYRKSKFAL